MRQNAYETIIQCVQFGAPAIAEHLIRELNEDVALANETRIKEAKAKEEAELKRKAEELKKTDTKLKPAD